MTWIYQGDEVSRDDMNAKFKDTYIKLKKFGVCRIDGFERESVFVQPLRDEGRWIDAADFHIEQEYPKVGIMVNYRKKALRISRTPLRQWRIGLLRSTLRLTNGEQEYPVANLNSDFVETLYNPKYTSIPKALEMVRDDPGASFAISELYWLRMGVGKEVELMRRDIPVGFISDSKEGHYEVKLHSCSCSFAQEIEDEFKDGKYKVRARI